MLSEFFLTAEHEFAIRLAYTYSHWLVALSYAVAVFASYTAFQILGRVIAAPNRIARLNWLVTGSVSMGSGIWSMHFVAMLAVQMDHEMRYDPVLTALSAVFAMLASGFAFHYVSTGSRQILRLVLAGTVLGAGIGTMHYTGMLAMRLDAAIRYDPALFGASIAVAVMLATLALRLMFFTTETRKGAKQAHLMLTAAIMGLSITLMHYTGMAATHFLNLHTGPSEIQGIDLQGSLVALVIGGAAFLILGLSWLGANIDQRMQTKNIELKQSQNMLLAIVETALDGILTFDLQGIVKAFNPAATKIFGYASKEVVGQPLSKLIPTFKTAGPGSQIAKLERDGQGTGLIDRWEMEGVRKDGSTNILEMSFSQMDVSGALMYTGIVRDVTKRHQAAEALRKNQAALRASETRLNAIMNSVVDAVFSLDRKGVIHSFNASAERIFGYSSLEAMGTNIDVLIPAPEDNQHECHLGLIFETAEANMIGQRCEMTGRRKEGASFPLEIAINSVDIDGQPMFVGVCTDITMRRQAEEERAELERELFQAQKLESLGTLSGGIAHEINTPLQYVGDNIRFLNEAFGDLGTVLQSYEELYAAAAKTGAMQEAVEAVEAATKTADLAFLRGEIPTALAQSLDGVQRTSEIVQAIKEFSHPGSKEKAPTKIDRAIETTLTVARNQWKYVAEVTTDFDETLPEVPCVAGELNQVFLNLIVNAAHAIEAKGGGGHISISTKRCGDWAEIRVSDDGTGIPEECREKIFEPFYTTKEPGKGTGQGLAITRTIITKSHQGTVAVESEVGKGTTFIIRLPIPSEAQLDVAS